MDVTDVPARVAVEYGIDDRYGVWSESAAVVTARSGTTTLTGLEPGTAYQFHIVAISPGVTPGGLRVLRHLGCPGLLARAPSEPSFSRRPRARSSSPRRPRRPVTNLTIDGGPIFPRMVWRQCPGSYPDSLAAGINVFLGTACTSAAAGLSKLAGKGFAAVDIKNHGLSGPGLIGWHLPDEGDESVGSAAGQPNIHDPNKVTFLTLTDHFAPYMAPPSAGRGIYPGWFSRADMIGFDTYPIESRCRFDLIPTVFTLQKTLIQMSGSKPTFQWIEAGPMEKCFTVDPTTASVRAETWLAIAAGARGIGYFPDVWEQAIRDTITSVDRDIVVPRAGPARRRRVRFRLAPGARFASVSAGTTEPST